MDLTKDYYIHTVHVFLGFDCCHNANMDIKIESTRNLPENHSCIEPNPFPRKYFRVFRCSPPATGRYVTVSVTAEEDVGLVLCEVAVYAFSKLFRFMWEIIIVSNINLSGVGLL